jgi:hypothetical protein
VCNPIPGQALPKVAKKATICSILEAAAFPKGGFFSRRIVFFLSIFLLRLAGNGVGVLLSGVVPKDCVLPDFRAFDHSFFASVH